MKSQMIVQLNYKQMLSGGEMRTGTILRSIDFVNQSPWYIITWLYEWSQRSAGCVVLVAIDDIPPGSSSAWVALCVHPSSLSSVVPAKTSEVANLDHLCSRLKKLVSACCVLIRFQHYFSPTRFPPHTRPHLPPHLFSFWEG